jgi:predicted esterase
LIAEHHLAVSRSARYFTIGEAGPHVTDVWFALHGYAQLASSFARHCQPLEAPHRLVVVPEGLSRFYIGDHTRPATSDTKVGASWMTREDRLSEIADYIQYLERLHQTIASGVPRPHSLTVLGFSQGTAAATRWLTRGVAKARRLVIWGAPMPNDLDPAVDGRRLREIPEIVLVAGDQDMYLTPKVISGEEARLTTMGARYRVIKFSGGHNLDPHVLKALAAK